MIHVSEVVAGLGARPWVGIFFAYTLGCFNTGYYLVRGVRAQDIRERASGATGATNVGRALGRWGYAATLFGDMLKGALVIYLARFARWPEPWQAAMACAVVVGHNWPAQLGFRGGKGAATSCGALLIFDPLMLAALLGGLSVLLISIRKRVLAGMVIYALIPVAAVLFGHGGVSALLLAAMSGLIIFSHRKNLRAEIRRTPAVGIPSAESDVPAIEIKIAKEDWEFEAIHRLNHQTFVREIPQHVPTFDGRLVDRFHAENTYVIAVQGRRLVGMMAIRGRRPFSLDAKIPDLDQHIPTGCRPVEVRLLAVEPAFRHTAVFTQLFSDAARHCLSAGFDIAVISATTRQLKLYRHLGFMPFGSLVGTADALYQPMFLTLERFAQTVEKSSQLRSRLGQGARLPCALNLLPGPVLTTQKVDAAFASPPISHRSPEFMAQMRAVRSRLCELTCAAHVEIIPGSGSLANAMVAAQLSLEKASGLVISNGEFGERLAAEAHRARLNFETLRLPWGTRFNLAQIDTLAARIPRGGWIWFVHHETSTGLLNPLNELKTLATFRDLRLCVDCISSLGTQSVNLKDVHLATGTSGKGLGAYPGLALVFHNNSPQPEPERLPTYLDLGHWAVHDSVPHTHSSNLLSALATALEAITPARTARIHQNSLWLGSTLRAQGFIVVTPPGAESSGIVTLALDRPFSSEWLGCQLEQRGFALNFRSSHMRARNWIQIALLGDPPRTGLERLVSTLREITTSAASASPPRANAAPASSSAVASAPTTEALAR
jgi:acyl-phosphate glycerol 3-phosphate acyltransferase